MNITHQDMKITYKENIRNAIWKYCEKRENIDFVYIDGINKQVLFYPE